MSNNRKSLNIGLFGFGCVGYGLYQVLQRSAGFKAEITQICVKNSDKQRPLPNHFFTYLAEDILNNEAINVVVELIDDADAAFDLLKRSLLGGKAFVTANKKMLAEHLPEIIELQRQTKLPVLYEAAACASIPIIRNLEEYYDNDFLSRIEGIVNGSTNYILSQTLQQGLTYTDALALAQAKGYAESNPALDVEGTDAVNKLVILMAHAFGLMVEPKQLFCAGIQCIGDLETRFAKEKSLKIKLIAQAIKINDHEVAAIVAPQFVSPDSPLFAVDDVYNGVMTETAFADKQFFSGKGAGDFPTASAVLSDLSALSYNYQYEYKKSGQNAQVTLCNQFKLELFLRADLHLYNELIGRFIQVKETYQDAREMYIIGSIWVDDLKAIQAQYPQISLVLCNSLSPESLGLPQFVKAHSLTQYS